MNVIKDTIKECLCDGCSWIRTDTVLVNKHREERGVRIRAGVCMYCPSEDKILIVQAYNEFIGLPKGGREAGETLQQTAKRELLEETGVVVDNLNENSVIVMHKTCTYYTVEVKSTDEYPVNLHSFSTNDVSGCGWIHRGCLHKLQGRITSHLNGMLKIISRHYGSL